MSIEIVNVDGIQRIILITKDRAKQEKLLEIVNNPNRTVMFRGTNHFSKDPMIIIEKNWP